MQSWDRDADVLTHMETVHGTESCLHPLCQGVKFEDKQSFYDHQNDAHAFRSAGGVPRKRKRDGKDAKQQEEDGPCIDSQPHILHNAKPKAGNTDDIDIPTSNESSQITFSPSPSLAVNVDEALLDCPTANTECKTIADAIGDKTNSVVGADNHAKRPKVQIKLNYKAPQIVLQTGKAQRYGKRYKIYGKGQGTV
jgi:hypothetical protein